MRFSHWELQNQTYVEVKARSPFQSIPHSFWWALVTATTVGYGDMFPTTDAGKITAGLAMVYSLCVLALPVGVIGANFNEVWKDYDDERTVERELKDSEETLMKMVLEKMDPLVCCRRLMLELYHNSQMFSGENDIFLGEAEVELDLSPDRATPNPPRKLELLLKENRAKSDRKVGGCVYIDYTWTPQFPLQPGVAMAGQLVLTVLKAAHLVRLDWKNSGLSDPYVVLTLHPKSPTKSGISAAQVERTFTVYDEVEPEWNVSFTFELIWHCEPLKPSGDTKTDVQSGLGNDDDSPHNSDKKSGDVSVEEDFFFQIPSIRRDVAELQSIIPRLQIEVQCLRQSASDILEQLGVAPVPSMSTPQMQTGYDMKHCLQAEGFEVPGAVPKEHSAPPAHSI